MSYWGHSAWENDSAADWLDGVFEESSLDKIIFRSLRKSVTWDTADEIRAAAMLMIRLGSTGVYPPEKIDEHLDLAIKKVEELLVYWDKERGWDRSEDVKVWLENELIVLKLKQDEIELDDEADKKLDEWWAEWMV